MSTQSVVLDTNLIFSALTSKASKIRDILLKSNYTFFAPNYLISEIYKHKEKLISISKLDESEFYWYFDSMIQRIQFISLDFISISNRQKAYDLCKDIDIKDTPFIALSLELKLSLWTGDKKLKDGLRQKDFTDFFNI